MRPRLSQRRCRGPETVGAGLLLGVLARKLFNQSFVGALDKRSDKLGLFRGCFGGPLASGRGQTAHPGYILLPSTRRLVRNAILRAHVELLQSFENERLRNEKEIKELKSELNLYKQSLSGWKSSYDYAKKKLIEEFGKKS